MLFLLVGRPFICYSFLLKDSMYMTDSIIVLFYTTFTTCKNLLDLANYIFNYKFNTFCCYYYYYLYNTQLYIHIYFHVKLKVKLSLIVQLFPQLESHSIHKCIQFHLQLAYLPWYLHLVNKKRKQLFYFTTTIST